MRLAIYGTGKQFDRISKAQLRNGIEVVGVFDSNPQKCGKIVTITTHLGKRRFRVEHVDKISKSSFDKILITPIKQYKEILEVLRNKGVGDIQIVSLYDYLVLKKKEINQIFWIRDKETAVHKKEQIVDVALCYLYKRMKRVYENRDRQKKLNCCVCPKTTVLYKEANIINPGEKKAIRIGEYSHIRGELNVWKKGKIEIGEWCYVGANSYIWSCASVHIGNNVLIGHGCNIFDNDTHPKDGELRHVQYMEILTLGQPEDLDLEEKEIWIGDNVWIGAGCTILKGVTIGNNSIIGVGTIVNRDVPENSIAYGKSMMVIRDL